MSEEKTEVVKASHRQQEYRRKRPYTRDLPTVKQRLQLQQFTRIAHFEGTDNFGTVETADGNVIPRTAKIMKDRMKPVEVAEAEAEVEADRRLIEEIIRGIESS